MVYFATPNFIYGFFLKHGVVLGSGFAFARLGFYSSSNQISFSDFARHFTGRRVELKSAPKLKLCALKETFIHVIPACLSMPTSCLSVCLSV